MEKFRFVRRFYVMSALVSTAAGMTSCFVEIPDDSHDQKNKFSTERHDLPLSVEENTEFCPSGEQRNPRYQNKEYASCFVENDYKWRVSCKSSECQAVPVFVHYMLSEDLGSANTVTVEAFDNNKYLGAPSSTVQINNYQAKSQGDYKQTEMFLAPGSYYLRAFIANEDELLVPYTYQGMELISEKPIGVYGAISSPASVVVAPRKMEPFTQPVHITLDKLFKNKQEEPDSKAFLRLNLSLEENAPIANDRKVLIQLRDQADLGMAPLQEFAMLTEAFMIEGRKGQAEFLSTSLPIGNYFVFVFADSNGNDLYDDGELSALVMKNAEAVKVAIKQNRTETLSLVLKAKPELPESVL